MTLVNLVNLVHSSDSHLTDVGGDPERTRARLCVSHVCHQWREIALNQPQLWRHINFNIVSLAGATEILFRENLVPFIYGDKGSLWPTRG